MPDIQPGLPTRRLGAIRRAFIAVSIRLSSCAWAQDGITPDWRSIQPELKSAPQVDIASIMLRMHVDSRASSVDVAFLKARLVAPSGDVLQTIRQGDAGERDCPSARQIAYGTSPPAMICAAAAARCEGRPLICTAGS